MAKFHFLFDTSQWCAHLVTGKHTPNKDQKALMKLLNLSKENSLVPTAKLSEFRHSCYGFTGAVFNNIRTASDAVYRHFNLKFQHIRQNDKPWRVKIKTICSQEKLSVKDKELTENSKKSVSHFSHPGKFQVALPQKHLNCGKIAMVGKKKHAPNH